MNSSLQFAALTVLCLFPFLVIVSAESGGDARHALIARLSLDQKAARDVNELMTAGRSAVTTLSIVGAAAVLLGAIGLASTLQVWYQRVYDQPPARNLTRQFANRLLWLAGWVACCSTSPPKTSPSRTTPATPDHGKSPALSGGPDPASVPVSTADIAWRSAACLIAVSVPARACPILCRRRATVTRSASRSRQWPARSHCHGAL